MYSPKVIALNQSAIEAQLKTKLVRHSIDEVDQANAFFDSIHDGRGGFTRDLTSKELEWLQNERILCRIDFDYWTTRYHWIKNVRSQVMRFAPNTAQMILLDLIADLQEQGKAQFIQSGKARQEGVTTLSEALVQHRVQFCAHLAAIVGSSDPRKSAEMVEKMFLSWDLQPFWLKPATVNYSKGEWYKFSIGASLWVQHGSQKTDMGRGTTPVVAHLSECADFDNAKDLIEAGLLKSLHETPDALFIAESTANGDSGWWYDTYQDNKKYAGTGDAKMVAHFLPWYVRRDLYPTDTWLQTRPIPEGWQPNEMVRAHAERAKNYVANSEHLQKYMGVGWEMPIEQQYYYQLEYDRHRRKKMLQIWFREMPADDFEMFTSPQASIFDTELISDFRNSAAQPKAVYGIRGDSIPRKFWPKQSDFDREGRILRVRAAWNPHLPPFDFEFVPLKFGSYPNINPNGKLFVWEYPEIETVYGFSADTSDGLGQDISDNSVIEVMRKGNVSRNDAQVAEFSSPEISGTELWPWGLAIGTLYAVPVNGKIRQPKCVPEIVREGGRNFLNELEKRGWKSFHQQIRRSSIRRGVPNIIKGWYMTEPARNDMLEWFIQALENEYIEINSPWLIREMDSFIKNESGRLEAKKGKHDDRFIGMGILHDSMYRDDSARNTGPNPIIERKQEISAEDRYPLYNAGNLVTDELAPMMGALMGERDSW
jgi:hypothetical protein